MRYLAAIILTVAACSNQSFPLGMSGQSVVDPPEPVSTAAMPAESIEFHYEIPTPVIDYDAEWKAFVHESVLVHAQKPEHAFWSAATTTTTTQPIPLAPQTFQKPTIPQFTLGQLVDYFFEPQDRAWAMRVAFCESSGQPDDVTSDARHHRSGASGWFQHLPKFWDERSEAAGIPDTDIMDPIANVLVASWLLYETPQGTGHWYPSQSCWG